MYSSMSILWQKTLSQKFSHFCHFYAVAYLITRERYASVMQFEPCNTGSLSVRGGVGGRGHNKLCKLFWRVNIFLHLESGGSSQNW